MIIGRAIHSPDDLFAHRTVSVPAELIDAEVVISCRIQHWREPAPEHPLMINEEAKLNFVIKGADNLQLDKRSLKPAEAAEELLSRAFLN